MNERNESDLKLFTMLGADLGKCGNQWSVLYGENIGDGVVGYGDTPMQAIRAFNQAFYHGTISHPTGVPTGMHNPNPPIAEYEKKKEEIIHATVDYEKNITQGCAGHPILTDKTRRHINGFVRDHEAKVGHTVRAGEAVREYLTAIPKEKDL